MRAAAIGASIVSGREHDRVAAAVDGLAVVSAAVLAGDRGNDGDAGCDARGGCKV